MKGALSNRCKAGRVLPRLPSMVMKVIPLTLQHMLVEKHFFYGSTAHSIFASTLLGYVITSREAA